MTVIRNFVYIGLISFVLSLSLFARVEAQTVSEIDLNLSADQVVNLPLIGNAQIRLLDSQSNPVNSYDMAGNPISLDLDSGQMVPALLDDPSMFSNGVIDLASLDIHYQGESGIRLLTAANNDLASLGLLISFNGYDILSAFDLTGNQITTVYSGLPTTLNVTVRNGGSLTAATNPYVKAFFTSDISGSVKRFFPAKSGGTIDTIAFLLENTLLQTGLDTLVLLLSSQYEISGTTYTTADTLKIPVTVLDPASFAVIPGSIEPGAVYDGPSFDLSFEVNTSGFSGPIDSTFLIVDLVETVGEAYVTTIYSGAPTLPELRGDTLVYQGLAAMIDSTLGLGRNDYQLRFDYRLISGSNIFILTEPIPGSLTVLERPQFGFFSGSLRPNDVAIDQETQFDFTLHHNLGQPLIVESSRSTIDIEGDGFSSRTNLVLASDTIDGLSGSDTIIQFSASSERIIIPASLLGKSLSLSARIYYREPTSGNSLLFETNFDSTQIEVVELPVAQIISVDMSSINAQRVNAGQSFEIMVSVASKSQANILSLPLRLSSDGGSIFDAITILPALVAFDTVSLGITVQAGAWFNPAETFLIEIASESVIILPAIDNTVSVHTDLPAEMMLDYDLSESAADGLLEQGESFNFVITWSNSGTAPISGVNYQLTVQGLTLPENPIQGTLGDDTTLVFFMTAPDFDATLSLTFELLGTPLDLNLGQPAPVFQPFFEASMEVLSTEASLIVESSSELLPLIVPGEEVTLLELSLTNSGRSAQTTINLRTLQLILRDKQGEPVKANSLMDLDQSGFYEGLTLQGRPNVVGDSLLLIFGEFLIEPGMTKKINFVGSIHDGQIPSFEVGLAANSFDLVFADERLRELEVQVESTDGSPVQIHSSFQSAGSTFKASFMAETNPFNPHDGPLSLAYVLDQPSGIELRIFTLVGELVYEKILPLGSPGTNISSQPHLIEWDGANNKGVLVLNGVYIAQLTERESGAVATLKIAVVK